MMFPNFFREVREAKLAKHGKIRNTLIEEKRENVEIFPTLPINPPPFGPNLGQFLNSDFASRPLP